jgi:hypothetical protein
MRLEHNHCDSTDIMALNRQPDLFLSDPQPELLEDRPEHVYRADPGEVRRDLMRLLAQVRAAQTMPWEPRKVRLYRTIFPEMSQHLPDDEAKQLCFEFEAEIARLEAA